MKKYLLLCMFINGGLLFGETGGNTNNDTTMQVAAEFEKNIAFNIGQDVRVSSSYRVEPLVSASGTSSPAVENPCGQGEKSQPRVIPLDTSSQLIGEHWRWENNSYNNWMHDYVCTVTAPALNSGIHKNGGGGGKYSSSVSVTYSVSVEICTETWRTPTGETYDSEYTSDYFYDGPIIFPNNSRTPCNSHTTDPEDL